MNQWDDTNHGHEQGVFTPIRRRRALEALLAMAVALTPFPAAASDDDEIEQDPPAAALLLGGSTGGAHGSDIRVLLADSKGNFDARPSQDQTFSFNGRRYRGNFSVVDLGSGRQGLIATMPIEAYLYGVVSMEMPASWPTAALQAQAIVARSYATARIRPDHPYDVTSTVSAQVHGGIDDETESANRAIDATAGALLMHGGKIVDGVYSSCCGGHTADAADVWNLAVPYLIAQVDPNCIAAPNYRWSSNFSRETLMRALAAQLTSIGSLHAAHLNDLDASGRPRLISFDGETGSITVPAPTFRSELGATAVRSTLLFEINLDPASDAVIISGGGSGHGVGMCQWGAKGMAGAGRSPQEILAFYFPGTTITKG
ncbi:MAG TPA: SpoIID/LytB domain-containing protein [Candidatus Baltobacteraceae bacterium]|jgi:stage II sporulation protein D|nr:SpoIID/LytB domain-containing protein [Candidatus Baltobacteraceae bacterium]